MKVKKVVRCEDRWRSWPEEEPQDGGWIIFKDERLGNRIGKFKREPWRVVTPERFEHRLGVAQVLWKPISNDSLIRLKDGKMIVLGDMPKKWTGGKITVVAGGRGSGRDSALMCLIEAQQKRISDLTDAVRTLMRHPLGCNWKSVKEEPPEIGTLILLAEKKDDGWRTWCRPVTADGYVYLQAEHRTLKWCEVQLPQEGDT